MKIYSKLSAFIAFLIIAGHLVGCMATTHTVGSGGKDNCKSPLQSDVVVKQWYLFWGMLPISKKDTKAFVGNHENYTIRTTTTFTDGFISYLLTGVPYLGWIIAPRIKTIRISYGNNTEMEKTNTNITKYESLKILKDLFDSGAITKDEFEAEKSKLMVK